MKGRWRILKTGIHIHGSDAPDKVFFTCCALHNKVLEIDGLDEWWEEGIPSVWLNEHDNEEGDNNNEGNDDNDVLPPNAIVRLNNPATERNYGIDQIKEYQHPQQIRVATPSPAPLGVNNGVTSIQRVCKLSLHDFRQRLVTHFSIAVERNEVQWSRRFGNSTNT